MPEHLKKRPVQPLLAPQVVMGGNKQRGQRALVFEKEEEPEPPRTINQASMQEVRAIP